MIDAHVIRRLYDGYKKILVGIRFIQSGVSLIRIIQRQYRLRYDDMILTPG